MTPQPQPTVGIDLAQASFEAALACSPAQTAAWRELPQLAVDQAPDHPKAIARLQHWLTGQGVAAERLLVVVESTGQLSRRFAWAWRRAGGDRQSPSQQGLGHQHGRA